MTNLQDEIKRKEQRWTSSTSRMRDRIEQLETENGELKEEIKVIEKKRLELWQAKDASKAKSSGHTDQKVLLTISHVICIWYPLGRTFN